MSSSDLNPSTMKNSEHSHHEHMQEMLPKKQDVWTFEWWHPIHIIKTKMFWRFISGSISRRSVIAFASFGRLTCQKHWLNWQQHENISVSLVMCHRTPDTSLNEVVHRSCQVQEQTECVEEKIMTPPWSIVRPQIKSVSQCQVNKNKMFSTKCHKRNRMKLLPKVSLSFSSFEQSINLSVSLWGINWVSIHAVKHWQCHWPWLSEIREKLTNTSATNAAKNTLLRFPQIETQHGLGYSIKFNCWGDATELSINFNRIALFFFNTEGPWKEGLVWNQYQ